MKCIDIVTKRTRSFG